MPQERNIKRAMELISDSIRHPEACCALVDEGYPDETSIMGTRDGYLNLAYRLLEFVHEAESGNTEIEEGVPWHDGIKQALFQLPDCSTWIVGCYLHPDHTSLLRHIEFILGDRLHHPLSNDPDFRDPASDGV